MENRMPFVTFMCIRSGNTVKMFDPDGINELRGHEGYIEVQEVNHGLQTESTIPQTSKDAKTEVAPQKKHGRPARKVI